MRVPTAASHTVKAGAPLIPVLVESQEHEAHLRVAAETHDKSSTADSWVIYGSGHDSSNVSLCRMALVSSGLGAALAGHKKKLQQASWGAHIHVLAPLSSV